MTILKQPDCFELFSKSIVNRVNVNDVSRCIVFFVEFNPINLLLIAFKSRIRPSILVEYARNDTTDRMSNLILTKLRSQGISQHGSEEYPPK